jgi:serine protease
MGIVLVAAAGNAGNTQLNSYPAIDPNVIAVSATNYNDTLASYSDSGSKVELSAPGGDGIGTDNWNLLSIRGYRTDMYCINGSDAFCTSSTAVPIGHSTAVLNETHYRAKGTSFAAPHVAGLAGLIRAKNPQLSVSQIKTIMFSTADDIGNTGRDNKFGYGRINVGRALQSIHPTPPPISPTLTPTTIPLPTIVPACSACGFSEPCKGICPDIFQCKVSCTTLTGTNNNCYTTSPNLCDVQ